ncbi:primosomal protein N' [Nocardia xishanensis]|uniref:primosomal protein N' family DNA-binding protein n=1 Tax=Nocardia xishanensis TaxID=238964 RepID=UPI0033C9EF27
MGTPTTPEAPARPIARVLPLLTPAHLDRDFDYLVPPELDEIAQPGVRVRVRFAGRLVDGYLLARLTHSEHVGKLVKLERVVSAERVLTPEILRLATAIAARYAGTRADVLRLAIPPRHARTENGGTKKTAAADPTPDESSAGETTASPSRAIADPKLAQQDVLGADPGGAPVRIENRSVPDDSSGAEESADLRTAASSDSEPLRQNVPGHAADSPPTRIAENHSVPDDSVGYPETFDAAQATARGSAGGEFRDTNGENDSLASVTDRPEIDDEHRAPDEPDDGAPADVALDDASDDAVPNPLPDRASEMAEPSFDTAPWERYVHGGAFLAALGQGKGVRAAWQAMPGEDWARRLAELAATVVAAGRSAILMVPDQRDLARVLAECVRLVGDSAVGLTAGLGPAARYRRWLAVLRGSARVVVGTRSAVFAPAANLGLIAIWDDGDDTYAEPRAPYPHAREVSMLRVHETGAAFVAAGFARTAEIQAVVDSGWAHDLVADRSVLRKAAPRISAPGDSDIALERDPVARAVRIPAVAFAAARAALKEGAAVLVQVPRRGYVPALACAKCRTPARCRHCNGPLALPEGTGDRAEAHSPSCRWCGITETAFRCPACASRALRAVVIGAARTAEELGRAFPGVPIRGSGGGTVLDTVEPGPQVIVSTVGAEPVVRGGYGVALLLDGWALLSRADLRAAEDALRRWMSAAALVRPHGQVVVMAEPSLPTVQALVRWDPLGHARAEVDARAEVGFPPAVRLAAVDGATDAIDELLSAADLPADVEVLGPVPLPATARKPFAGDSPAEVERMLLRVPRRSGAALSRALTAAQAVRSTHRSDAPLRVQIDPIDIG